MTDSPSEANFGGRVLGCIEANCISRLRDLVFNRHEVFNRHKVFNRHEVFRDCRFC